MKVRACARETRGSEKHQKRDHRKSVPREHVEHDHAGSVGQREREEDSKSSSALARCPDTEKSHGHKEPKVTDCFAEPNWRRPLGVAVLTLGIEYFSGIREEYDF